MEDRKTDEVVILKNDTTERAVLGTILRDNELYRQNEDMLAQDLFHSRNRSIFAAMRDVLVAGGRATPVTVSAQMEEAGEEGDRLELQRLIALADADTFPQNVRRLVDYENRNMARLLFQQSADKAVEMGVSLSDTVTKTEEELRRLTAVRGTDGVASAAEAMMRMRTHIIDVREDRVAPGIMTGFRVFDANYGIHDDQLVIIAARTGVGKSALAMNIAANVARKGTGVAYYSLEMGVEELWARVIAKDMEMRAIDILHRKLADYEIERFDRVAGNFSKYPLYIDEDATVRFERLLRSIRKMHQEHGVKLFVVDYLQILKSGVQHENEALSLAYMSRELKNIAKELHVAVILLSQMNRSGAKDGIVTKFALRGSGEIEEAADTVVLIDRPDASVDTKGKKFTGQFSGIQDTTNKAVFIIDKGRSTGGAEFLMDFIPEYTTFVDSGTGMQSTTYDGVFKEQEFPFGKQTNDQPF